MGWRVRTSSRMPWSDPRAELLLFEAINSLPEGLRQAYRLHLAGLSYEQIALRLGISEGTVGSRLTLARRQLRERLIPALRALRP
jgi:RNA polymerase sigma-70 factor (ECF subfamily)